MTIYRESHLEHHRDEHLTDPDRGSGILLFHQGWPGSGWVQPGKLLARWNTTLLGRLTIGPAVMLLSFLVTGKAVAAGRRTGQGTHLGGHMIGVAAVLFWVTVICGMPFWLYFFGFVYLGAAMTRLRSYAEHRYADGTRSARRSSRTAMCSGCCSSTTTCMCCIT